MTDAGVMRGSERQIPPAAAAPPKLLWLTPSELDREHWRWRGMKQQHGCWNQVLWCALQDEWRRNVG